VCCSAEADDASEFRQFFESETAASAKVVASLNMCNNFAVSLPHGSVALATGGRSTATRRSP